MHILAKNENKNSGKNKSTDSPPVDIFIESNLPTKARSIKKIRTTKKIFGTIKNKDRVAAMTPLP